MRTRPWQAASVIHNLLDYLQCKSFLSTDLSENDALYPLWDDDDLSLGEESPSGDSAPFLNLTVQEGATATLNCAFSDITDRTTVSMIFIYNLYSIKLRLMTSPALN